MARLFDAGARGDAPAVVHDRVLTAANVITAVRLVGLPVFAWLMLDVGAYGRAGGLLAVIAATDWVDGYVARRFDQVTRIGKLVDPLVDRALLAVVAVVLLVLGWLPWWVVALIVGRDVMLLGASYLLFKGPPAISVTRIGKTATAFLLIGIPWFILANMDWPGREVSVPIAWAFTVAGTVLYYVAGAQYARLARTAIRLAKP